MKKIIILVILIVVALFVMGTDLVVDRVQNWVIKNEKNSSAARIQYSMAGFLYMVAQRQAKAVDLYHTAFRLFPGYPDEPYAHNRVGLYYESKKDYPKATEEFQIIIKKWPDMAEKLALTQRIERFRAYQGGI
ncbi:MAG: tetratricopeptide repeat protein [Verrucomicrobiae bacterium]|nr:tetratricopeptide repeat protein [Verrucomicrobiae bacterium]